MVDEEIRTFQLSLEQTASGITASIPWAQRNANGAVVVRVHLQSAGHTAGELLLNEGDLIALDPDERPLRTQVRRFWGYNNLGAVTPAHLQTARFDAGFRTDLAAAGGWCGLLIVIVRTFSASEGPKAVGGPWVFRFRVADDQEVTAAHAEAARADAARQEAARLEAERIEAARREAAQREAARLERLQELRSERTVRGEGMRQTVEPAAPDGDAMVEGLGGRRPPRFRRPERVAPSERWGRPAPESGEPAFQTQAAPPPEPPEAAGSALGDVARPPGMDALPGPGRAAEQGAREAPAEAVASAEAEPAGEAPAEEGAPRGRPRGPARAPRTRRPRATEQEGAEGSLSGSAPAEPTAEEA